MDHSDSGHSAWARTRVAVATLATCAAIGCNSTAPPPDAQVTVASATPDERLELVMRRLNHALNNARPAVDTGVNSTRQGSYTLHRPAGDDAHYTATIVIETRISLANQTESASVTRPISAGDNAAEGEADDTRGLVIEDQVEKSVYKLAYINDRWELTDPPQEDLPETEQICFQYALSDG